MDNTNGSPLDGSVTIGTPITVTYTFDDSVPDDDPNVNVGDYMYNIIPGTTGRLFSMTFTVGNYRFTSAPGPFGGHPGYIAVIDSTSPLESDEYHVGCLEFTDSNNVHIDYAGIGVYSPYDTHTGTAAWMQPDISAAEGAAVVLATDNYDPMNPVNSLGIVGEIDTFFVLGDMNGSNGVTEPNGNDIHPFIMALIDRPSYELAYPGIDADVVGDIDGDGAPNGNDIKPFVQLLVGGSQAIPEPASLSLLALGGLAMLRRRRK